MDKTCIQSIICFLFLVPACQAQDKTSPPTPNCNDCRSGKPDQFLVVIDPGHGGNDSGAQAGGVLEKNITLDVAHFLGKEFKKRGWNVIFTRTGDYSVSLPKRARTVNEAKPDLFLSIHVNWDYGPSTHGFEIWIREGGDLESKNLADCIRRNLVRALVHADFQSRDRGVKDDQSLHILKETHCPAGLVELGFVTHATERSRLTDPKWQKTYAGAIAKGAIESLDSKSTPKKIGRLKIGELTPNRRFGFLFKKKPKGKRKRMIGLGK